MSKKKNTLKDLDEFLKQQAASLVSPPKLSENPPAEHVVEEPQVTGEQSRTAEQIVEDLGRLAALEGKNFRTKFYELIIRTLEQVPDQSPSDKMLINTALYLKNPQNWKEVIRNYWRGKKQ
jgi:hypothetical protein